MRAELANACPCDIRSAWDEDRLIGRAIARGFVFDDAIDRIGWAMGRVGDHAVMSVEIEAAALRKKGGVPLAWAHAGREPLFFLYRRIIQWWHICTNPTANRRASRP